MKFELKHLAGYLPYGLKFYQHHKQMDTFSIYELELLHIEKGAYLRLHENYTDCSQWNDTDWCKAKPILRPLSDLAKEIEVNGEKFIPIEWFRNDIKNVIFEMGLFTSLSIKGKNECFINCGTYIFINNKLLEWHFDIYELIENGLAIDINTLK